MSSRRPSDPRAVWEPEWAVRVRVKSHTMAMLGENSARSSAAAERNQQRSGGQPGGQSGEQPEQGAESLLPNPAGLLKGLFGR